MSDPVVIVAGFGRCGSSLTMQMLHAGGFPCVGEPPAFEDPRVLPPMNAAWLVSLGGQAVKVLDPHRHSFPASLTARSIWLDRDTDEQGKSLAKFMRLMAGVRLQEDAWRALARSVREDRPTALWKLADWPMLQLRFEAILANPQAAAEAIARFLPGGLNIEAAAAAVRPRHPACAPGLDMEFALVAEIEGRRA